MKRRWIIVGGAVVGLIVLVIGVASLRASRASAAAASLQTVALVRGPLTASVGATGTVRPNQLAVLSFETTGTVDRVLVETGDIVHDGDRLADLRQASLPAQVILAEADLVAAQRALDDLLHSNQALAQAQLALANARDALEKEQRDYTVNQEGNRGTAETVKAAQAKLAAARERMEQAKSAYEHAPGHLSDGGPKADAYLAYNNARIAYNQALSAYNWYTGHPTDIQQAQLEAERAVAQAAFDDAQREYDRLKDGPAADDIAAAEARVAAAQATLENAWIAAPFDGTITRVDVKPGDQVAPGSVAFEMADLRRMLVDVEVSEIDINRVQVGQPVTLTFDAILDRTYTGHVIEVGLVGVEVQGVVNFPVTVELDDSDALVRPGLTAAVNLVVDQIEEALLVPNRAVRVRDGDRVVYVLRNGQPTAVPIQLGVSSDTDSQVLGGDVAAGDLVLLNPPAVFEPPGPGSFFRR
ncbi:MAG TPA: efflux RND transporter periplasmic adaptor subunit [Anaerolineales bacterium]|nr:efflux RND transporter periplasmic adaptor subunit [Anaerolineales bacterium]